MVEKKELNALGFTGFERLQKAERDGMERLVWCGSLYDIDVVIILIKEGSLWELEKIKLDNEGLLGELKKYFPAGFSIDEVIKSIELHGRLGSIAP